MTQEQESRKAFTGRGRRVTRRSVKVIDTLSRYIICTGGIGVTFAFTGIILFLFWVAVPLFRGAVMTPVGGYDLHRASPAAASSSPSTQPGDANATDNKTTPVKPLTMGVDENLATAWVIDTQGNLSTHRLRGGERVQTVPLSSSSPTAISDNRGELALGFADGTVRVGRITQEIAYVSAPTVPQVTPSTAVGESFVLDQAVGTLMTSGQVRTTRNVAELSDPLPIGPEPLAAIQLVDYFFTDALEAMAVMRQDQRLFLSIIKKSVNVMTGKVRRSAESFELPVPEARRNQMPKALLLGLNARSVFLVYEDGHLARLNTSLPRDAYIAEELNLLDPTGQSSGSKVISSVRMLLGNLTLIVADSAGGLSGWFSAPFEDARDNLKMSQAHVFLPGSKPIVAIGTSSRDRQFVTLDLAGRLAIHHMTSTTTQGVIDLKLAGAPALVTLAPKTDAIVALDHAAGLSLVSLNNPHPDGSFSQLFLPIHYEYYAAPAHIYQSSAGTDDAEPKIGLVALIFGTIKATFYALFFAVPIAIMAAIYSSEFMHPQIRAVVKPLIELMSSLPSVVLGFIGALVFAPFVENHLLAVLLTFVSLPVSVVLFGFFWQIVPPQTAAGVPPWLRFAVLFPIVGLAIWICFAFGGGVEHVLFSGSIKDWLGGRVGTATPGWFVLLSPVIVVLLTLLFNGYIKPFLPLSLRPQSRSGQVAFEAARYAITLGLGLGAAWGLGVAFSHIGWDLRGPVVGDYVQRNSLIVGMLMGFAIIPIIYTVSEDALSSVPNTLRSAALGAGATPWQTAVRVVLPVATSGIFSACMIGFGRAAGETMIVLMASGRTPIIDMNIFNGLSALSANIATELPEAPVNSTHYRMLFVSALVLFVLTFIVNTTAEIVRLRFRKRAYQL